MAMLKTMAKEAGEPKGSPAGKAAPADKAPAGKTSQEAIKEQMRMQEEQQARARKRLSDSVQGVTVPVYQRRGG